MAAVTAKPTELPIWEIVLKTPPARAWVVEGKALVMMRLEIVKRTRERKSKRGIVIGCRER